MTRAAVAIAVVLLLTAACAGSGGGTETGCQAAFREAAAVDEMADTNEDLNPAIRACSTLEEWTAASALHPDAFDGVDPREYLGNRCSISELSTTKLCQSLP